MNRYNVLSFLALLAVVIAIPLYTLQEGARLSQAQDQLRNQSLENGIVLYLEFCADCHGSNGEGLNMNPALNRLGLADADPGALFAVISRAAHGSTMSSWHLEEGGVFNDHQIQELVTLIRFADWSNVQQSAAQRGLDAQDLATRDIQDTSANLLPQEDPHQCVACHEDPQVHKGMFGFDCVRCHTLQAWLPASLTRHTFELDHGDEGDLACEICHIDTYAQYTCYECHDHQPEQMVEPHQSEGIDQFEDCIACHPTGVKEEGKAIWQEFLKQDKNKDLSAAGRSAQ